MLHSAKSHTQALSRCEEPFIVTPKRAIGLQDTGGQQMVVNIADTTAKKLMLIDKRQDLSMLSHGDFRQVVHGSQALLAARRTAAGYFAKNHVVHEHLALL